MKSRLVVYGKIQKGRHDRCLIVVLDDRLRTQNTSRHWAWRLFPDRPDGKAYLPRSN